MSTARVRPPWAAWLYTHIPFYAMSVVLMLFGVRAAFGALEIGSIDSWNMLGVLAAYTVALAGIAVAIVRWGSGTTRVGCSCCCSCRSVRFRSARTNCSSARLPMSRSAPFCRGTWKR